MKVLFVFGTRPEAIKLCPVIRHMLSRGREFDVKVCVTAQHRLLLDQVLQVFQVVPDYDLDVMLPSQSLFQSTAGIISRLEPILAMVRPEVLMVQGDTTSTFCGALAGFYARIPVGHVEAGLRTRDRLRPFPEELNRVMTTRLASIHFAPTQEAAENLKAEAVPEKSIFITGNTVIDAVRFVARQLDEGALMPDHHLVLEPSKRLIVVTAHRRETCGQPMARICRAVAVIAARPDVQVIFPVHPNPEVRRTVNHVLGENPNVILTEPLPYVGFLDLLRSAYLLLTDSGGIQEEASALGKPVLVLRAATERHEAVAAESAQLVGTDETDIVKTATLLLDGSGRHSRMARVRNLYGDGNASRRIAAGLLDWRLQC